VGGVLAEGEMRTLAAVAEALLEGAPGAVSARTVAENVDVFLVAGKSRRAWRVRVLLRLIEASSLVTHARPFSRLSVAERRRIARERWAGGRHVYRICAKIRNLVILGAYGDRGVETATGYVPVPLRPRFRAEPGLAASGGA
jgi:hypothetical protein